MPGIMRVIAVDGTITNTPYPSDPPLKDLHAAIGPIEGVPGWNTLFENPKQSCAVYVGSEAKGVHGGPILTENLMATTMWDHVLIRNGSLRPGDTVRNHGDYLAGPVVLVFGDAAFMRSMVE